MTNFTTSRGTRGQHVLHRYASAPYKPSPARREHIHGRIRPMVSSDGWGGFWGRLLTILVVASIAFLMVSA